MPMANDVAKAQNVASEVERMKSIWPSFSSGVCARMR